MLANTGKRPANALLSVRIMTNSEKSSLHTHGHNQQELQPILEQNGE